MSTYENEVLTDPIFLQGKSYDAKAFRKALADIMSEGIRDSGDCALSLLGGLNIRIAAGICYVLGGNVTEQGMFREYESATKDLAVGTAHATLPRLDQVIMRIMDNSSDSSTYEQARIEIIPGTATSGATLDNRNGAADLESLTQSSKSYVLLHDILVPAGASSLSSGDVRDKRVRTRVGHGLAQGPDIALGVSTTVAGLGTAFAGRQAYLRLGSTPFSFVPLIYDGTLTKWISDPVFWATLGLENAIGTDATFSSHGGGGPADLYIFDYKAFYDAGLRLQVVAIGRGPNVAVTWNYKLRVSGFNSGDTSLATLATSGALISGTGAVEHKASGWTDLAAVPTESHAVLIPLWTYSNNANSPGVTFGYRWVSA